MLKVQWRSSDGERGDSLIEFAVVAVVLFTCIFGIIDCSRALYAYHFASYAAREATRYAIVRGSTWGSATCASTSTFNCNASATNIHSYVQSLRHFRNRFGHALDGNDHLAGHGARRRLEDLHHDWRQQ